MDFSVKFELIDVNSGETVCTSPMETDSYELGVRRTSIDTLHETLTNDNNI